MEHLSIRDILAYVAEKIEGDDLYRIESHLASCRKCASKVMRFHDVHERFDEIWNECEAGNLEQKTSISHIREALAELDIKESTRSRLSVWLDNFSQKTGGMIRLALDITTKAAHILEERIDDFIPAHYGYQFVEVPSPVRVLGEGPQEPVVLACTSPSYLINITIDPAMGKISVLAESMKEPWPLIILIPREKGTAAVGEFRRLEGVNYLLAEFEEIKDGEYTIFFESLHPNIAIE